MGSATKRQLTQKLVHEYGVPVSRACKLIAIPRSQFDYESKKDDSEVIEALQNLAFKHPTYGFRKPFAYLRRGGKLWNHKRVYRIYKLLKLNRKRKGKCRLLARVKQPSAQQSLVNQSWGMDLMSYSMVDNRKFRTLNVMDVCSREVLAIEVGTSLSSRRVIRTLDKIIEQKGKPVSIRTHNGPEFTSKDLELLSLDKGISLQFIQPGKPMQNGYIERFNRHYHEAILDS